MGDWLERDRLERDWRFGCLGWIVRAVVLGLKRWCLLLGLWWSRLKRWCLVLGFKSSGLVRHSNDTQYRLIPDFSEKIRRSDED